MNYDVINYIHDFLGYRTPRVAEASFHTLLDVMGKLGLNISQKKLVRPITKAICLGIEVDTVAGTVAIPPKKLADVKAIVNQWDQKHHCTKRELQSLLGTLLYVHKCVRPAHTFLNRMLDLLCHAPNPSCIALTEDFRQDLCWFQKFLPSYNGLSLYAHRNPDYIIELDACLTGLGGCCGDLVYHLSIPKGFKNLNIVHLEMVNILVALRLFMHTWKGACILIKCDNDAVVKVLSGGKARDPFLAACAWNSWYLVALADVHLQYVHVLGKNNHVADLLSHWQNSQTNVELLHRLVPNPRWIPTDVTLTDVDYTI